MRDMISKKNSKYLYVHTYFSSISPLKAFLGHGCESQLRPVTLTGLVSTELTQQPWIEIRHLEKNMMIPEKKDGGFLLYSSNFDFVDNILFVNSMKSYLRKDY